MRCLARLEVSGGQLSVTVAEKRLFEGAYASATLSDGTCITTLGGVCEEQPDGTLVVTAGDALKLVWTVGVWREVISCTLAVSNAQGFDVGLERMDVLVVPAWSARAPLEMLQAGYQSWSFATPVAPLAQMGREASPPIAGPLLPLVARTGVTSYGLTYLDEVLVGFTTARALHPTVSLQPDFTGFKLVAGCYGEGKRLRAGFTREAERLVLVVGCSEPEALELYTRLVLDDHGRREPVGLVPTGWCSWYYFFGHVTPADVYRNLELLDAGRGHLPVSVVQLDDGYQTAIGDWMSLAPAFVGEMHGLVSAIQARGFKAGIWLAPFLVSEHSQTYGAHPDWVVKDSAGLPLDAITNWGSRNFALDTTHPDVQAHLQRVLHLLVEEWGFEFLKIDFVYAAALCGTRFDADATSLEAYRLGLKLIREVAGERFVLGCGAPFLPSVGFVDGMRVGPDTATFWASPDPLGSAPALKNAIRSTLAHTWMHGRFWINDPDCLIARVAASDLTTAEVESWATVIALSGGMVLLGDDLTTLEPERLKLITRLLPPYGLAARPLGPFVDGLPGRLALAVATHWGDYHLLALFNWHDDPQEMGLRLDTWPDLAGGPWHVVDVWSGAYLGLVEEGLTLGWLAPHGVRLLALHAPKDRPQLVGTTLTLSGGATDIASVVWQDDTLVVTQAAAGRYRGEVLVWVPTPYEPDQGHGLLDAFGCLHVLIEPDSPKTLRLGFKRREEERLGL